MVKREVVVESASTRAYRNIKTRQLEYTLDMPGFQKINVLMDEPE